MQELTFIIHILSAVFLVILIFIQHGKGADMGAAFGSGASQTVFGSTGSVPFLIKVTTFVAVVFFSTSIGLGYFISKNSKVQDDVANVPATTSAPVSAPEMPQSNLPQHSGATK